MRVLITGANGFIGRACVHGFIVNGWDVRALSRRVCSLSSGVELIHIANIDKNVDWATIFSDVDCVLHLASVVHLSGVLTSQYQQVNVEGTALLADEAKKAGVSKFVLVSSIAVNGRGHSQRIFDEESDVAPEGPYAESKLEAERVLQSIASGSGMSWVIIRPPMVYGPDSPGNFKRLVSLVRRGLPLPLAAACSPRSYIGLDNLVSVLVCVASSQKAANHLYLVSDNEDMGTADLIRLIAGALGKSSRLWWLPHWLLYVMASIAGKRQDAERVLSPLRINSSAIQNDLGWTPSVSVAEGIRRAVIKDSQRRM